MNITVYLGANEGNDPALHKAVRAIMKSHEKGQEKRMGCQKNRT